MIFGLDAVALSTGYILAKLAACPAQGKVDVNVTMQHMQQPYVTGLNSATLTHEFGNDPDSTSSTDGKWMVGGLNKSNIRTQYRAMFSTHSNSKTGDVCFSVKQVDFEITYLNTIYIANDYMRQGCVYSVTLAHEKRHVQTDLRAIKDFMPYAKKIIRDFTQSLPPQGPYSQAQYPLETQRVLQQIATVVQPLEDALNEIRRREQAKIDTIENYKREAALCPGQFPSFDGVPQR
jgi:hypothetical protein